MAFGKTDRIYPYFIHESSVDGEKIEVMESPQDGYLKIAKRKAFGDRQLHIYEAKKVYRLLNKEWPEDAVVHHVDGQRRNPGLSNLCVFETQTDHVAFHARIEHAMYAFLYSYDLLDKFFEEYPNCKLKTLRDLIQEALDNNEL